MRQHTNPAAERGVLKRVAQWMKEESRAKPRTIVKHALERGLCLWLYALPQHGVGREYVEYHLCAWRPTTWPSEQEMNILRGAFEIDAAHYTAPQPRQREGRYERTLVWCDTAQAQPELAAAPPTDLQGAQHG